MSAPIAGNFDCAKLLEIKAKVADIFANEGVISAEYIADVEAAQAVLENQTAQFQVLEQPDKDREVKIWWVDDCDDADPTDCTDQCVLEGEQIGTQCKDYVLTECFEKSFSVTEEQFRTSLLSQEEVVARALLKKLKLMDEYWAAKAVAFLDVSAGVNAYSDQYTVSGNTTYVPAAAWNPDLFGYFDMVKWINKLNLTTMLSGTLLRQYLWQLQREISNPEGQANLRKLTDMGLPRFDRRLDSLLGDKGLLMWDANAVALVTKARYTVYGPQGRELIADGGKQMRSTIASPRLTGVTYDLIYQEKCANDDVEHVWKIVSRGDYFLNPLGCDNNRTGVLKFLCGTGS